jgi:hypothetical protein
MTPAVRKLKIQKRLGSLKAKHNSACWVCGSGSGIKTAREAFGQRCRKCIADGRTTPDVIEYDRLKIQLERLNDA